MPTGARPCRASNKVGNWSGGPAGWVKNRPNSGPKAEAKPSAFSCPLLQFTCSENGPGRAGQGWLQNWGWGGVTANKTPSPPLALCQNHFRYPEMGVSGCWLHSRAQRGLCPAQGFALGVWPSPGICPGSPAVAAAHASVPRSGRGENRAAPYPRPSHFLSFLKKHKTLEIHVLYDREKKST